MTQQDPFLLSILFILIFDFFRHNPLVSNLAHITLRSDINTAKSTTLTVHKKYSHHASTIICISLQPKLSSWDKVFWDRRRQEFNFETKLLPS